MVAGPEDTENLTSPESAAWAKIEPASKMTIRASRPYFCKTPASLETKAYTMLIAGPAIWVDVLGYQQPLFGSNYPTLIALPLALVTAWGVSMLDARRHDAQARRAFEELAAKASQAEA